MSEMWTMSITINYNDGRERDVKFAEATFEDHMYRLRQSKAEQGITSMVVTLARA